MADLDDGFHRRQVADTLRVVDPSSLTIKTFHAFELVCHTASRFLIHTYTWTGGGIEGVPRIGPSRRQNDIFPDQPTPRLHGPVIRTELRERLLLIDMGRVYQPKQTAVVTIEHMFVDTAGTFGRYLSHDAVAGNEHVSLTVILPQALNPPVHSIAEHIGSSEQDPKKLLGEEVNENRTPLRRFSFSPPSVKPGVRYKIDWSLRNVKI